MATEKLTETCPRCGGSRYQGGIDCTPPCGVCDGTGRISAAHAERLRTSARVATASEGAEVPS